MQIIQIVLPIFLIILIGFILRKYNFVKPEWIHVLNSFVYYVSLPAIILISFWQINWQDGFALNLMILNILFMVLVAILLVLVLNLFKLSPPIKAAIFMVSIVGNTVYMGFPIVGSALRQDLYGGVVAAATIQLVLGLVLSILAIEYWVVRSKKFKTYFRDFIQNPLIISLFAGIVLSVLGLQGKLIEIIQQPISMLAATASPVALFTLGAFLHGKFIRNHFEMTLITSAIKLLIFPILGWFFARLLNLSFSAQNIIILVSCLPVAVTAFVIAEQYKLNKDFVANAILISTAFSIATISFFLFLLI